MKSIYEYLIQDINDVGNFDEESRFWIYAVTDLKITSAKTFFTSANGKSWTRNKDLNLPKGSYIYLYTMSRPYSISYRGEFNIGGDIRGIFGKSYDNTISIPPDKIRLVNAFAGSELVDASQLVIKFDKVYDGEDGGLSGMFRDCKKLKYAPEMITVRESQEFLFSIMFYNCESLINTPQINTDSIEDSTFSGTFSNCKSITEPMVLPNVPVGHQGCYEMFSGCSSLKSTPALPATTVESYGYSGMFKDCKSLVKSIDVLPAKQLTWDCYSGMFENCTSLKKAPDILGVDYDTGACARMFSGCSSLTQGPKELILNTGNRSACNNMFRDCKSLIKTPIIRVYASGLEDYVFLATFWGCKSLKEITLLIDDWNKNLSQLNFEKWVAEVHNVGTFIKPKGINMSFGENSIPNGWKINEV